MNTDSPDNKKKHFLVNVAYWAVILVLIWLFFRYLLNLLLPFVIALFVAWILRPVCRLLRERLPHRFKLSTVLSVAAVLIFYGLIGVLVFLLAANIFGTISDYVARLPEYYTQSIEPGLRNLYANILDFADRYAPASEETVKNVMNDFISSLGSTITGFSMNAVGKLTGIAASIPGILLKGVIAVIATVFMTTSYDAIRNFLEDNLPNKLTETVGYVVTSFRNIILMYGKSYLLIMLITFAEILVGLLIIGVRHAALIAALIAIFDIFPVVGAGMILLPWTIVTLLQGRVLRGIGLGILYVVVIVVRQFMEPKIVGKTVGLPPLVTLACMFVGSSLCGAWGLVGFPIAAAILTNLNNDPDIPIHIFKTAGVSEEEQAEAERKRRRMERRQARHARRGEPPKDGE